MQGREQQVPFGLTTSSRVDGPRRLIKMKFLMLIFVFLQKKKEEWGASADTSLRGMVHVYLMKKKSLHIFNGTPHCLVMCQHRLLLLR